MWPPLEYYAFSGFFNCITCGLFAWFVLSRKPDLKLAGLYAAFATAVSLWSLFYGITFLPWLDRAASEFSLRTCMFFVAPIPTIYLHFVTAFTRTRIPGWVHALNHGLAAAISLTVYSSAFAVGGQPRFLVFPYWLATGPFFHFAVAHFVSCVLIANVLLFRAMRRSTGAQRAQFRTVLWGVLVAWTAGASNYAVWYRVPIPPAFNSLVSFVLFAPGYAMIRHKLFDVDVIIKRTVVFAALSLGVWLFVGLISFWLPARLLDFFGIQLSPLALNALSVIVVVRFFDPVRRRLVAWTDRYLFQRRYDERTILKRFVREVLALDRLDELARTTVSTLVDTLRTRTCGVWLRGEPSAPLALLAGHGLGQAPRDLDPQSPLLRHLQRTPEGVVAGRAGDPALTAAVREELRALGAVVCLPLTLHEELLGVLSLGAKQSDEEYTPEELVILQSLAATIAIAANNTTLSTELARTQEAATTDALTGTLMRRAFLERAVASLGAAAHEPASSLLMIDLDHFKDKNDVHGHLVGDAVLQEVATRLGRALRQTDLLGRFGGEEFVILLPGAGAHEARVIAERVRQQVAATPVSTVAGHLEQTLSIGIATTSGERRRLEELIAVADQALYAAKRAGRNRVVAAPGGGAE